LALLLSFPPGLSSTLRAGLGVECRYGVIISMSRAVLHLILPSSSTYIIPRLVAKCQVYSTLHHYFIVLFLFSIFTTNFQLLPATSILVERGEVVPIKVKVCTRAHNIVGSSARFPTYTLSLLFYIGGRESF